MSSLDITKTDEFDELDDIKVIDLENDTDEEVDIEEKVRFKIRDRVNELLNSENNTARLENLDKFLSKIVDDDEEQTEEINEEEESKPNKFGIYKLNGLSNAEDVELDIHPVDLTNVRRFYNGRIYLLNNVLYLNGAFMYKGQDNKFHTAIRHEITDVNNVNSVGVEELSRLPNIANHVLRTAILFACIIFSFIFNYVYNLICNVKGMSDIYSYTVTPNYHIFEQVVTGFCVSMIFVVLAIAISYFANIKKRYCYISFSDKTLYFDIPYDIFVDLASSITMNRGVNFYAEEDNTVHYEY